MTMYENVERTEKPCNYSLISAKIAMTGIKRRCCSHAFCLLPRDKLSPRVGRAAVKLGAKRDCIDIDVSRYYWRIMRKESVASLRGLRTCVCDARERASKFA